MTKFQKAMYVFGIVSAVGTVAGAIIGGISIIYCDKKLGFSFKESMEEAEEILKKEAE